MIQIYVAAKDAKGEIVVSDQYEFEHLPRKGDEVIIEEGKRQHMLEVQVVRHFHRSKSKLASVQESVHLECKLIDSVDL